MYKYVIYRSYFINLFKIRYLFYWIDYRVDFIKKLGAMFTYLITTDWLKKPVLLFSISPLHLLQHWFFHTKVISHYISLLYIFTPLTFVHHFHPYITKIKDKMNGIIIPQTIRFFSLFKITYLKPLTFQHHHITSLEQSP